MTRLSTGYRINSAMDDAAGLQIATRLNAQNHGVKTAMGNIQNGISLLQTSEGVVEGLLDVFGRMRDLAVQAADGSMTSIDKEALSAEFSALYYQHWQLLDTKYNGEDLFVNDGKLLKTMSFQTGATSADTLSINLKDHMSPSMGETLSATSWGVVEDRRYLQDSPREALEYLDTAIQGWTSFRSGLGSTMNRLSHASESASSLMTNTTTAMGSVMDTDFASESAAMASGQMLMQSATTMLKKNAVNAQLVISLLQ